MAAEAGPAGPPPTPPREEPNLPPPRTDTFQIEVVALDEAARVKTSTPLKKEKPKRQKLTRVSTVIDLNKVKAELDKEATPAPQADLSPKLAAVSLGSLVILPLAYGIISVALPPEDPDKPLFGSLENILSLVDSALLVAVGIPLVTVWVYQCRSETW